MKLHYFVVMVTVIYDVSILGMRLHIASNLNMTQFCLHTIDWQMNKMFCVFLTYKITPFIFGVNGMSH